jgi:hypothetical protein
MQKLTFLLFCLLSISHLLYCQSIVPVVTKDSMCNHPVVKDGNNKLLSWYKPSQPGAAYGFVVDNASTFIKNCPNEKTTGLPYYLVNTWIYNEKWVKRDSLIMGYAGSDDSHTPACTYASFVQSLVLDYFPYSGDSSYITLVKRCLDHLLAYGTTSPNWVWANVPYASSKTRETIYQGVDTWGYGGRGDGLNVIEPDKVGEMGYAYVKFYQVTGEKKYLDAAIHCSDALVKNAFLGVPPNQGWEEKTVWNDKDYVSPWPFRVHARTGFVYEPYTSNVIEAIKLFDELIRIGVEAKIEPNKIAKYKETRKQVWNWLMFATIGPMHSMVWKGYFEDIPNDNGNVNRVQKTPLETARYLLKNNTNIDLSYRIPMLLYWVKAAFGGDNQDAIKEQFWCYDVMGSHTARYASICALWYEKTNDEFWKDQAFRHFNWATYMSQKNGYILTTPWGFIERQVWFSDGYGDYIHHFMEGMAAIPEWAPDGENHLLRSTSVVQDINYQQKKIRLTTFDTQGKIRFKLFTKPKSVQVDNKPVDWNENCRWKAMNKNGILDLEYSDGKNIEILFQ